MARRRGRGGRRRPVRRRPVDPLIQQVQTEGDLRFKPQSDALRALLMEDRESTETGIRAAQGAARGIQGALKEQAPRVAKLYSDEQNRQALVDVKTDLASLGAAADPYKAISANQAAQAARRLAEASVASQAEFAKRSVTAEEGRTFQIGDLLQKHQTNARKIGGQAASLAEQRGTFEQAQYGNLKTEKRASNAARRVQRETERKNRATERLDAAGERRLQQAALDTNALGVATLGETQRANRADERTAARNASTAAKKARSGGGRAKRRAEPQSSHNLKRGVQNVLSVVRSTKGTPAQVRAKALKAGTPRDLVNAAMDLNAFGYLSGPNYAAMKRAGMRVPRAWRPRARPRGRTGGGPRGLGRP